MRMGKKKGFSIEGHMEDTKTENQSPKTKSLTIVVWLDDTTLSLRYFYLTRS